MDAVRAAAAPIRKGLVRCQYCGADVPKGMLGYHYAGFQQPACPEVRMALDPAWWPTHNPEREMISDEVRAKRKAAGVQRRREILRGRETLAAGRRRRAALAHEGMRLA